MPTNDDAHIDWSKLGKKPRAQINAEAAAEKRELGLSGRHSKFRAHVDGTVHDVPAPDVRAIRERLHLSQAEFARRFSLSARTVQQWEQRRAMPDIAARILLKAIERAPEIIAAAAADVRRDLVLDG